MADAEERSYVDYECKDHIVTIAMNRPEKLNAASDELIRQLIAAFRRFDADPDAYVAILCGRGRAFYRDFGLCRLCFRQSAHRGEIPGVVKSSW